MAFRFISILTLLFLISCSQPKPQMNEEVLRIATMDTPETLDPHRRNALGSLNIIGQMYEPLVVYDRNLGLKPALAESWENPTENQWRFRIRRGVRFHNGQTLNAYDVAATFDRLLHPNDLEIASYVSHVADVKVINDYVIDVTTTRLSTPTLHRFLYVYIVPRNYSEYEGRWHQVSAGTGPFQLVSANESKIVLSRFPQYWGNGADYPNVEFHIFSDSNLLSEALESKKYQVVKLETPDIPESVREDYYLDSVESLYVVYIGINMARRHWIFASQSERKMLDESLNRNQIIQEARSGYASTTVQMIPPFVYGFDPSIRIPASQSVTLRFSNPPEMTFLVRQVLDRTGLAVAKQFEQLGLKVKTEILSDQEFFKQIRLGEFDLFISRWGCITADSSELLENQFYTAGKKEGMGLNNYTRYSSPEIDKEIEEAAMIDDPRARINKLQRVVSQIDADYPWIPLYISHDVYGVSNQLEWSPRLDSRIIAVEMRKRKKINQ